MKEVGVYDDSYEIIMEWSNGKSFAYGLWNLIENYREDIKQLEKLKDNVSNP